jgi:hypothetical protein
MMAFNLQVQLSLGCIFLSSVKCFIIIEFLQCLRVFDLLACKVYAFDRSLPFSLYNLCLNIASTLEY